MSRVHAMRKAQKNPRKRPPDPRDPRVQTLLFWAQPESWRRAHKHEARYVQYANLADLMYDLVLRDGYRCLCCGSTKGLNIDHVRPVSKGGKTELENLQILCRSCNEAKDDQIIDYRPKLPEKG
jgi:5-methylcytosine-specific restriction endonuclease McrA